MEATVFLIMVFCLMGIWYFCENIMNEVKRIRMNRKKRHMQRVCRQVEARMRKQIEHDMKWKQVMADISAWSRDM